MDQVKIGKFIAEQRKSLKMTQLDLANKLGITDRAVSKWENGRGMPDISLIRPLCEELLISVNELLNGEKIEEENRIEKAEESIISAISYSDRKIKRIKRIFICILAIVLAILIFLPVCIKIDTDRMNDNRPVIFGTWGFDYTPPVGFPQDEVDDAIKEYLVTRADSENDGEKAFVSLRNYLVQETEAGTKYSVYAWVVTRSYYIENGQVKESGGSSVPYKIEVENCNGTVTVTDSRIPRDGSYYVDDMKAIFPDDVRESMENIHEDGTYEELKLDIAEQVQLYFQNDSQ